MKKKRLIIILSITAFYIILLLFLLRSELEMGLSKDGSPLYSIATLSDAFWYMLATFTSVGYGDMTPVSPFGKFVGVIFMLSSTGILVLFIHVIFSWMMGDLAPRFKIFMHRHSEWVILSSFDEEARSFMDDISEDGAGILFICAGEKNREKLSDSYDFGRIAFLSASINDILDMHRGNALCTVLLTDEDKYLNYETALHIRPGKNIRVICKTAETPDRLDPMITLFDEDDCLARYYWHTYPVKEHERDIVIIGDGALTDRLLERGYLINVFPKGRELSYHVFSYKGSFSKDHPELIKDTESDRDDRMIFHDSAWQEKVELISHASRIILCDEDTDKNLSLKNRIRRYFPAEGTLYVFHHGIEAADAIVISRTKCVYTKDLLLNGMQNKLAVNINELYRKKVGGDAPKWEQLSEFHRQASIAAADHLLTKVRLLLPDDDVKELKSDICHKAYEVFENADGDQRKIFRKLEHKRWMRFYLVYNWIFYPVRDNRRRRHPLLVPFEELSEAEQLKDDVAWEVLNEDIFF
ncbi:MAG: hypothetical protein K5886_01705 [Lachnospiraceae bacterium]|nr:hypothetical protein [Lachnospiraceae bacterium]